ncbi:MAG: class I tRNA ligase family protein, partial [Candidatus Omnitrophota bacterium]
ASSDELTRPLISKIKALGPEITSAMDKIDFSQALVGIWVLINMANKFIEQKAPWRLSKENRIEELKDMIYDLCEVLRVVSIALWPFLPMTSEEMARQLGLEGIEKKGLKDLSWGLMRPGTKVAKARPLFPRIEIK